MSMERRRNYEGLDALRGVAALVVLVHHLAQLFPSFLPFFHGYLGVDLFFLLSGFVIGHVYEAGLAARRMSLAVYAETRLARLYPMIGLGVLLGLLAALLGPDRPTDLWARFIAQALVLPALWAPGALFLLNSPHWSLFFELAANFFHAAIAPFLRTRRLVLLVALCAVAYALAMRHWGVSVGWERRSFVAGFPRTGFGFFGGLLLYRLTATGRLPERVKHGWLALPAFPLIVAGLGYAPLPLLAIPLAVFLLFPAIVIAAAGVRWPERWRPATMTIGALSYVVYAIQAPLIAFATPTLQPLGWWPRAAAAALVALLICAIGLLVEIGYDRPVRRRVQEALKLRRNRSSVGTAP